jgi:recombination protein RecT
MANENSNLPALAATLKTPKVVQKFQEMLGKRAPQFITSITSVVNSSAILQKADVNSIIMGAAIAAAMDMPLNANLGYAALVPFNSKDGCHAQLQIMVRGWTELFLRSGQCQQVINEIVYEGQLIKKNKFTGEYVFDEDAKKSDKMIGVMAYFRLTNGFEKVEYMSREELEKHAKKYSQTYKKGYGLWVDDFEAMAKKTVLKRLIVKWAPKSIEMQQMVTFDQAVVKGDISNLDEAAPEYMDNDSSVEVEPVQEVNVDDIKEEVPVQRVEAKVAPQPAVAQALVSQKKAPQKADEVEEF